MAKNIIEAVRRKNVKSRMSVYTYKMRDKAVAGQKFMRILGHYTNKLDFEPSL
jgi:hypothetical protein